MAVFYTGFRILIHAVPILILVHFFYFRNFEQRGLGRTLGDLLPHKWPILLHLLTANVVILVVIPHLLLLLIPAMLLSLLLPLQLPPRLQSVSRLLQLQFSQVLSGVSVPYQVRTPFFLYSIYLRFVNVIFFICTKSFSSVTWRLPAHLYSLMNT